MLVCPHISYTMGTCGLPDIYTLGPAALWLCVYIYQANHSCPWYNYYIYHLSTVVLNSRDWNGNVWLPKNRHIEKPFKNQNVQNQESIIKRRVSNCHILSKMSPLSISAHISKILDILQVLNNLHHHLIYMVSLISRFSCIYLT